MDLRRSQVLNQSQPAFVSRMSDVFLIFDLESSFYTSVLLLIIIVSLSEPSQYEYPQDEQKITQSSPPDYTIDYAALDYNQDESKMDDYDAFDYVNGDFDKVRNGGARTEGSSKKKRPQQSKHNNGKL